MTDATVAARTPRKPVSVAGLAALGGLGLALVVVGPYVFTAVAWAWQVVAAPTAMMAGAAATANPVAMRRVKAFIS